MIKKQMRLSFFKKLFRSLIMSLVGLVGITISSFIFVPGAAKNLSKSQDITSLYEETTYDFVVNGLKENEESKLLSLKSIDDFALFYEFKAVLSVHNEEVDIVFRSLEKEEKLGLTDFNSARKLDETPCELNPIYLQEAFAKTYGLSLGEELTIGGFPFNIAALYRNSFDTSMVYVPHFMERYLEKYSDVLAPSGAYLKCFDSANFLEETRSFSEMRILQKNENKKEKIKESESLYKRALADFHYLGLCSGLIYLLCSILILIATKKKRKNALVTSGRVSFIVETLLSFFFSVLLGSVSICLFCGLLPRYLYDFFVSTSSRLFGGLMAFGIFDVFAFLSSAICLLDFAILARKDTDGLKGK